MNDAYLDTQVKNKKRVQVFLLLFKKILLLYFFEWAMEVVSSLLNEI